MDGLQYMSLNRKLKTLLATPAGPNWPEGELGSTIRLLSMEGVLLLLLWVEGDPPGHTGGLGWAGRGWAGE